MKLSKRGEYALRALIDLGIASELGWPMLQISELASKEKLPIKFLEQIFTQLKSAGYVASRRGKFGGYSLARPMSQIKFSADPLRKPNVLRSLLMPRRESLRTTNVDVRRPKRH
jgi:Rrf2 family protein